MIPAPSKYSWKMPGNEKNLSLYIGYTNNMKRRLEQKEGAG
jgi:predicted GIY-YIG superfamily endonuclease